MAELLHLERQYEREVARLDPPMPHEPSLNAPFILKIGLTWPWPGPAAPVTERLVAVRRLQAQLAIVADNLETQRAREAAGSEFRAA